MLDAAASLVLESAAESLAEASGRIGRRVEIDVHELIHQRGREPQGTVSAGGSCRLLPTTDGWVAVSLNRADDWELLPALFRTEASTWDWDVVAAEVALTDGAELESAAIELGLALAVLPAEAPHVDQPWCATPAAPHDAKPRLGHVVDLSALWAGPLCASLLQQAGADVISVQSTTRPEGARTGVRVDFGTPDGRDELHRLIGAADVVVSSARMRGLQQLGLDPFAVVEKQPGLTWVGISAYGMTGPWNNRIGYGDDTAVAGGLVSRGPTPAFIGDAIADPITGLYAAIAALEVAASGGGVVDIALRDAAAYVARASR